MEIVKYPDPLLRQLSDPVEHIDEKFLKYVNGQFFQFMKDRDGLGLAAPQAGILKRFFVFDSTYLTSGMKRIVINPEIIERTGEEIFYEEGCLSLPEIYAKVKRHEKIRVKYINGEGEETEEKLDGINARVFQHEYDHLKGVLFIDRLSPVEKVKIKSELKMLKKEYKKNGKG